MLASKVNCGDAMARLEAYREIIEKIKIKNNEIES